MTLQLIGKRYGEWEVLSSHSKSRSGATRYFCRCSCGTEKDVLSSHLVQGQSLSCGCLRLKGKEHKSWTGHEGITGQQWGQILRSANGSKGRRLLEFTITIEYAWELYVKQKGLCALSSLPITLRTGWTNPGNASLDRIDSGKGYIPDNVQWVHKDINLMKNKLNQEYFISLCQQVAENLRNDNEDH